MLLSVLLPLLASSVDAFMEPARLVVPKRFVAPSSPTALNDFQKKWAPSSSSSAGAAGGKTYSRTKWSPESSSSSPAAGGGTSSLYSPAAPSTGGDASESTAAASPPADWSPTFSPGETISMANLVKPKSWSKTKWSPASSATATTLPHLSASAGNTMNEASIGGGESAAASPPVDLSSTFSPGETISMANLMKPSSWSKTKWSPGSSATATTLPHLSASAGNTMKEASIGGGESVAAATPPADWSPTFSPGETISMANLVKPKTWSKTKWSPTSSVKATTLPHLSASISLANVVKEASSAAAASPPKTNYGKTRWSPKYGAVHTFLASSSSPPSGALSTPTPILLTEPSIADLAQKEYQLEELEDKEECETEVWLNDDGSVTLGATNGPMFASGKGDWHLIETATEGDLPFRMRLTRAYESTSSGVGKMGDVTYEVTREFWGNIEMIGDSIAVSGKIHGNPNPNSGNAHVDNLAVLEYELGYFTMIDAVASEGVEGEKESDTAQSYAASPPVAAAIEKKGGYGIGSWKK